MADCPKKSGADRPPTPRHQSGRSPGRSRYGSGQKVNFRVSRLEAEPPALGRDGDVDEEEAEAILDAYMATQSLQGQSGRSVARYGGETDYEDF